MGLALGILLFENNQSSISNYHTAISSALTYYNNPTITAGFNRVFLSGGIDEINWSEKDAMNLVFQPLFGENIRSTYKDLYPNEPAYWDPWDQMISVFFNLFSLKIRYLYILSYQLMIVELILLILEHIRPCIRLFDWL